MRRHHLLAALLCAMLGAPACGQSVVTARSGAVATSGVSVIITGSSGGAPLSITTGSLPGATVGSAYAPGALTATGGSGSGYTFNLVSATPDTGLWSYITPSGAPGGTPENAETDTVTYQVTDGAGHTAQKTFSLAVAASGTLTNLSPTTLPNATDGGFYAYQIIIEGGAPPYQCTAASAYPWWLSPECWILGTPTSTGSVSLPTITITDSEGSTLTYSPSLTVDSTLRLTDIDPTTGQINLPPAIAGNYYQARLLAAGGSGTLTYSAPSGLPSWASINSSTGLITGTPTVSGNVAIGVEVADTSSDTASATALINVSSSAKISRPSYNSSSSNGFFVEYGQLYDPNGYPFQMVGLDRNHFNSASWASDANGALSGTNAVRAFGGFGLTGLGENQTASAMATQITDEYIDNGVVPIITVAGIPVCFTGSISGTTLTVSSFCSPNSTSNAGIMINGMTIYNSSGTSYGTITSTGSGGTGTYTISESNTVGSTTLYGSAQTSGSSDPNVLIASANMLVAIESTLAPIQGDILINLANEWGCNSAVISVCSNTASQWESLYETEIATLRTAGYTCPFVIDTMDDGEDFTVLSGGQAAAILADDTLQNVLFSYHLYFTNSTLGYITGITKGSGAVITFDNAAASNPWTLLTRQGGTNYVYVTGVSGMTQINGQTLAIASSGEYGGSSPNWTITTTANTSSYSTYTSGGIVYDWNNYQVRLSTLSQYKAGGIPLIVGEWGPAGPPAVPQCTASTLNYVSAGESTFAAAARAWGLPEIFWAWDNNDLGGNQSSWSCYFGMTGNSNTSYTNGEYVPSVPSSLTAPGMIIVLNPRTGLITGAVPASALH